MKSLIVCLRSMGLSMFFAGGSLPCLAQDPPVRIMPLGDSITLGCCSGTSAEGGYRNRLYTLLTNAGYNVDFVGTQKDANNPTLPDVDHLGMSGYQINQLRAILGISMKRVDDPDVILLHIGTNDITAGASASVALDRLRNLITDISNLRPYAKIVLATLIPRTDQPSLETEQTTFNQSLPQLVSEQVAIGRSVSLVDMHAALGPSDLNDGLHPNTGGYEKMADVWLPGVTNVITPLGTADPPAISDTDTRVDLEHVAVKFSKPVEDASPTISNFSISGGVTILGAELDALSKRIVTLTTSPQNAGVLYTVTVSGVRDRTPEQNVIIPESSREFTARSVVDGSFEAQGQGWTLTGNYEVLGPAIPPTHGTRLMAFNTTQSPPNAEISQTITTVPGQKYRLEFDMGIYDFANAQQSLEYSVTGNQPLLAGVETITGSGDGDTVWSAKSYGFIADSAATTLSFRDTSQVTQNVDLLLDDVRLVAEPGETSLTVNSLPVNGLNIAVSPADADGDADGVTSFVRNYNVGTSVNLTAPASFGGKSFEKWQLDSVNYSTNPSTSVTMNSNQTLTAVYKILGNGSFELGTPADFGTLDGWVVTGNPIGYTSHPSAYSPTEGNRLAVFSGGSDTFGGEISQSFSTTPGQNYRLNFDVGVTGTSGRVQRMAIAVNNGSPLLSQVVDLESVGMVSHWQAKSYTFVASGTSATLTFRDASGELPSAMSKDADLLLDNVVLLETDPGDGSAEPNTAPVANNDFYPTPVDTPLVVTAPGLLGNDSDAESDPLTAVLVSNPSHGSLTLTADGGFSYTPDAGYEGPDSFTYRANDGDLNSDEATVSIDVSSKWLANGSFELGSPVSFGSLAGWSVTGNPFGYGVDANYTATEGSRIAVFNGGVDTFGGSISQSFETIEGQAYRVSFDVGIFGELGRKQRIGLAVNGTGSLLLVEDSLIAASGPAQWYAKSYVFTADSTSTTLTFSDNSAAFGTLAYVSDLLLDNVRVNAVPTAVADDFATDEDTPLVVEAAGVLSNDTDLESDPLTAVLDASPAHGSVILNVDGSFTYTPDADFHGVDSFTYFATDGESNSAAATVSVTVNPLPDAPVAVNNSYFVNAGEPLMVPAPGALGNDSDVDGDLLTAVLDASPTHGSLTLNADGSFTYTPDTGYEGVDSFTYHANDGSLDSNVATVTLNISSALVTNGSFEVGVPPSFGSIDAWTVSGTPFGYEADEDYTSTDGTRLAVFNGGDNNFGGSLSQTFATTPGQAYLLELDVGIIGEAGKTQRLVITAEGTDTLLVREEILTAIAGPAQWSAKSYVFVADSASTTLTFADESAMLGIQAHHSDLLLDHVRVSETTVENIAPVAGDDLYATPPDVPLVVAAPGVLHNDSDAESSPLTVVLETAPSNGNLTLNADGSFSYTPNAAFSGLDSFVYHVNDGELDSNAATVWLHVSSELLANGSFEYGSPASFGSLDAWTVSGPPFGYAADTSYTATDGNRIAVFNGGDDAFGGMISQVIATVPGQAYRLELDAGIFGEAGKKQRLGVTVTSEGTLIADEVSFTAVAGPAQWSAHSYTFIADGSVATLTISDNSGPLGALANASDLLVDHVRVATIENARTLTVTSSPSNGVVVTLSPTDLGGGSGGATSFDRIYEDGASVTLTAEATFGGNPFEKWQKNGSDFSTDSTVVVTMDASHTLNAVYSVGAAPVASADSYATDEDVQLVVNAPGILSNDTDSGSQPLTAVLDAGPIHGSLTLNPDGSFTYDPVPDFNGADSFTYHANNGTENSTTVTVGITVNPVNDNPVAVAQNVSVDEDVSLPVTLSGTDVDGDALTYAVTVQPTHGVLSGTAPDLTYTPDADYNGPDVFNFTVNDGTADSAAAAVTITVNPVNDNPVAVAQNVSVDEDGSLPITLSGTDADGDALTYAVTVQPTHGVLSGTAPDLTYTPDADYSGPDVFSFTVNDGTADSAAADVTITVNPVNDNPVAVAQNVSVDEDGSLPITLSGTDADGDSLTYAVTAQPTHGVLSGTAPDLTYTPDAGYDGPDVFSFTVNDGTADSAPADVTITVNAVAGFAQWFASHELSGSPTQDHDGDHIPTSIEYVIGGNPANQMDAGLVPTVEMVAADPDEDLIDQNYLLFTYRRTDLAEADSAVAISVEWNTSLDSLWTSASGTPGVVILADDDAADTGVDLVRVYLPLSLAEDGKLFARLNVEISIP